MKNGVFWNVTPCGSCKNITEDAILHSHRREKLKSYIEYHETSLGNKPLKMRKAENLNTIY
jgi:hypothetical protein